MIDYKLDYDAFVQIQQGNELVLGDLLRRYHKYSKKVALEFINNKLINGISLDDLEMVCLECVTTALNFYVCDRGDFYPFWKSICQKKMIEFVKENSFTGDAILFDNSMSLDQELSGGHMFSDIKGEECDSTIELMYKNDFLNNFEKAINKCLTKQEIVIFSLRAVDGYTFDEISKELNISSSKAKRAFIKARQKLSLELKEFNTK